MKPLLAALTLALLASCASATCTPVVLSETSNSSDQGNGPYYTFNVNGTVVPPGSSNFVLYTTDMILDISNSGYVLVRAGYGGCTLPLNDFVQIELKVTDTTANTLIYDHTTQSTEYQCGNTYSCYFNQNWGGPTLGTRYGHYYQVTALVSGYVYGVGYSQVYSQSITFQRLNHVGDPTE